jgi:hypothetical protein
MFRGAADESSFTGDGSPKRATAVQAMARLALFDLEPPAATGGSARAPCDVVGPSAGRFPGRRLPMRPHAIRSRTILERLEPFVLALVAVLGALALYSFGRHVWNDGASRSDPPGTIVRCEIRTIFAPRLLVEFAKAHPEIATNDELIRLVREAWFAVVFRTCSSDGEVVDIPMPSRPGEYLHNFEDTRAVLCLLAGKSPGSPATDPTKVEIEMIDDALMNIEPVEGLKQLLGRGPGHAPRATSHSDGFGAAGPLSEGPAPRPAPRGLHPPDNPQIRFPSGVSPGS